MILVKLDQTKEDKQVKASSLKQNDIMETEAMSLKFDKAVSKESQLSFTVIDKKSNTEEKFSFGLNYWPSFVDYS